MRWLLVIWSIEMKPISFTQCLLPPTGGVNNCHKLTIDVTPTHHVTTTLPCILLYICPSVRPCVRAWEREVTGSHSTRTNKLPILRIARVGRYTKEPTDTASNGTSPGLKETLCNSAGQKFDREVSLRVAAWRRRTSAILESRLFTDAWQREVILF